MALLFVVGLVLVGIIWGYIFVLSRDEARVEDPPEVALTKRNVPEYARLQHARAEEYKGLLREVWAEDGVGMPTLSADLRQRIEKTLDR